MALTLHTSSTQSSPMHVFTYRQKDSQRVYLSKANTRQILACTELLTKCFKYFALYAYNGIHCLLYSIEIHRASIVHHTCWAVWSRDDPSPTAGVHGNSVKWATVHTPQLSPLSHNSALPPYLGKCKQERGSV